MIFMCVVHPLSFRRTQKENDFSALPLTIKRDFLKVVGNSPILLFYDDFDVCSKFYKLGGCTDIKRIFYNMTLEKSFPHVVVNNSNHLFYFDFHVCSTFYIFKSQITENAFSLLWRTEKQDFWKVGVNSF